jgi:hypothetical protein
MALSATVRQAGLVPIDRIDHVQLAMPPGGEDLAVSFYEGLLGIRQVPKPPHLAVRGGCWFENDDVKVHLGVDPEFRPARKAHPALLATDLQALLADLRNAGIEVRDDEPLAGYERVAALCAPDPIPDPANVLRLMLEPGPVRSAVRRSACFWAGIVATPGTNPAQMRR